jgi:hypothetical protein
MSALWLRAFVAAVARSEYVLIVTPRRDGIVLHERVDAIRSNRFFPTAAAAVPEWPEQRAALHADREEIMAMLPAPQQLLGFSSSLDRVLKGHDDMCRRVADLDRRLTAADAIMESSSKSGG